MDEHVILGNQAPFYFDNSVLDIYQMVRNGATLHIIPRKLFKFPKRLLEYVRDHGINMVFWVPSDFQVKHLGYRIELGEIESVVSAMEGVDLCACTYDYEVKQIVLFYCGKAEEKALRKEVRDKLLPYMVPGRIVKLEAMPRTGTGKVDRRAMMAMHG